MKQEPRLEDWIRERADLSDQIDEPAVDVSDRVMTTLRQYQPDFVTVDKTPLLLGGALFAVAASIVFMLLPSLSILTEPWISFWLI
ncbi:MAG: hypothetical protein AAGI63_15280 [Planctomycetota bacterium]